MKNKNHHQHFEKRVAVFGAGQAGRMVRRWLPAETEFTCYIDNAADRQGTYLDGIPVRSLEESLWDDPDLIFIAVLNKEAEGEIYRQIRQTGYMGEIRSVSDIRSMMDIRLSALRLIAEQIHRNKVEGVVAELGVYRGEFAAEINRLFSLRPLYLFDTFAGFDERDLMAEEGAAGRRDFSDTSEELVRNALPFPEKAVFVKGYFPDSLEGLEGADALTYAFVSLDPDLYQPTLAGLSYFYPRLAEGGMILVHDYTSMQFEGVRKAVDAYAKENGITPVPLMDLHGSAVIVKS